MDSLSDTSVEIENIQLELLRRKSPVERVGLSLRLSADVVLAAKRAIARAHPELSSQEADHLFIELNYGHELAEAVRQYTAARSTRS